MHDQPELSVIIPVFNEEADIHKNLLIIEEKLSSLKISYEIIVVDDGSRDQTLEQAKAVNSRHITVLSYDTNRGKGFAVRHGMLAARGQFHAFMDIDLSTSLGTIDIFLARIREGDVHILIGDRKSRPELQKIRQPFYRRFLGQVFTGLSSLCVGRWFNDFTCGFKMFNQKASHLLFQRQLIYRWAFDTELIYIALIHHLRIKEIEVVWNHHNDSTVRPWRDVVTSLNELFQIKVNGLKGLYR